MRLVGALLLAFPLSVLLFVFTTASVFLIFYSIF